jgi:hypothetical protein
MIATKDGVITMPTRTAEFKLNDPNLNNDLNPGYISEFKE